MKIDSKVDKYLNEFINPMFSDISDHWNISPKKATELYSKLLQKARSEGRGEEFSYVYDLFYEELRTKYKRL